MKKVNLFISLSVLVCFKAFSQNIAPAQSMEIYTEIVNTSNGQVASLDFLPTDTLKATMVLVLQDTTSINKINVKFGTTLGNINLLNKSFNFDENGNLSDGTSYLRKGFVVYLMLGKSFANIPIYYSEATLESATGIKSTAKLYNNVN